MTTFDFDAAAAAAEAADSTALLIVSDGRTVLERYWPPTDSLPEPFRGPVLPDGRGTEDVASVQKSVVSFLIGIAVERRLVDVAAPVSRYLGSGWSAAPRDAESAVTIRHLLTMTSGLDDGLRPTAPAGTVWAYSLGPAWHMLKRVLARAAGRSLDDLSREWLFDVAGLHESSWVTRPAGPGPAYPDGTPFEGLVMSARDLARFGQVVLAGGEWAGRPVGVAPAYLADSLSPSSQLNPSYGYLWWLNGQAAHRSPFDTTLVDGPLLPSAPADLVAASGAFGRLCHIVPSLDLVMVRLGGARDGLLAADRRLPAVLWEALTGSRAEP